MYNIMYFKRHCALEKKKMRIFVHMISKNIVQMINSLKKCQYSDSPFRSDDKHKT